MVPTRTAERGLRFTVAGTPITIDWTFLLIVALFSFGGARPLGYGLMFAGVAFVSIVWHEAGHAIALATFGRRSRIVIHGMGGLTISEDRRELTDSQSIIVSLAGPLAGVAVGLIALTLQRNDVGQQDLWSFVLLGDIIFINLGWGMINLLPILPLDGGHVMERITARIAPRSAHSLPHVISIAVAVVAAVVGYTQGYAFAALLAVMYGFVNARAIGDEKRRVIQDAAQERADAALALLSSDHPGEAIDALEAVMSTSPPPAVADRVMVGLAWALAWRMGPGDADKLGFLIGRIAGRRDTGFLGAVAAAARGANDEATALLVRGFTGESTPPPAWLVDRLMPSAGEVDLVATWIDQFSDAERHSGLGRLVASLESSGRPADANRVRSLASAPSARPSR